MNRNSFIFESDVSWFTRNCGPGHPQPGVALARGGGGGGGGSHGGGGGGFTRRRWLSPGGGGFHDGGFAHHGFVYRTDQVHFGRGVLFLIIGTASSVTIILCSSNFSLARVLRTVLSRGL